MTDDPSISGSGASEGGAPEEARLGRLAATLGLELPPFLGPLVAFDPARDRAAGDPVYLGGDLHAVHPDARAEAMPARDETLDAAVITLTLGDFGGETVETTATRGIWCVALHDELADSALYFMLRDSADRLRTWTLLPPAASMIGQGHIWLPRVPRPA